MGEQSVSVILMFGGVAVDETYGLYRRNSLVRKMGFALMDERAKLHIENFHTTTC